MAHSQKISNALSIHLVNKSRLTGTQQQNTDDQNCSDDNAERSTSVDWRTADDDDQQRRRVVCSCSSGTDGRAVP